MERVCDSAYTLALAFSFSFRTLLLLFIETVAVLFCPSILLCRLNSFSVSLVLFLARNSRGVSACFASWLDISSIERRIAESISLVFCSLGVNLDCECCEASCVQSRNMSSLLSCRTWFVQVVKRLRETFCLVCIRGDLLTIPVLMK